MRTKIIAVNALIVAVMGLLAFLLVRSALGSASGSKEQVAAIAQGSVNGAAAWVELDGLRAEGWLANFANDAATADALSKATPAARGDAATKRCDDIVLQAKNSPLFERDVPTFVAIVDTSGKIVGRNSSNMNRGDDIGSNHAGLRATLASGNPGSDVWYEKDHYLASYVGIKDEGKVVAAIVIGRPLDDALSIISQQTAGHALVLAVPKGDGFDVVAHSAATVPALDESVNKGAKDMLKNALVHQQPDVVRDGDILVAVSPLSTFENGKRALLVAEGAASLIQDPTSVALGPIVGALAIGLVLVIVAGWLLGNYITRPIDMLEEGLLAILNGQADKRFELDHAELGGLAFRIDQLLNQLMGVEEDTTDAEGRVSRAPSAGAAATFTDSLEVDDKRMQSSGEGAIDPDVARRLALEPKGQYYTRIYKEYITAKKAIGEATDHISEQAFAARIQSMEQDASQKYGRPVRYQVHARNKEVVLLAVPL
jgi:methyl-accepting chemotaxis protein